MPKVDIYNLKGEKAGELKLSDKVFGLEKNDDLLHQAFTAIASNNRPVIAHTKNRGEVAGSGRKPWRQKGTGNARVGSLRTPVWRKGGIVFGPRKEENFKKNINKKMNRKAILIALSEKTRSKRLFVVDEIQMKEKKTKEFAKKISNLKLNGSTLIGFSEKEKEFSKYARNLKKIKTIMTCNLNVYDLLANKNLVLSRESVKYLENKYQ